MTLSQSPRSIPPGEKPTAPRSLGTLAAEFVTCSHPAGSRIPAADSSDPGATVSWCGACGARRPGGSTATAWQVPSLTSALTRKAFEDLVVLLHAVTQLAQIARAHAPAAAAGSPAHAFLRTVRASLSAISHLPLVRDVDRIEEALATIPKSSAHP